LAKNVFKAAEIMYQSRKVFIEPPRMHAEEAQALESVDEYIGPTIEDLRREAEEFRAGWEEEKKNLLVQAQEEAEVIKKNAEHVAFEEVKRKNIQAQKLRHRSWSMRSTRRWSGLRERLQRVVIKREGKRAFRREEKKLTGLSSGCIKF